jgi:hypothetical protein
VNAAGQPALGQWMQGPFPSVTLSGQTVAVLHEFGHTVNALGTDLGPNAQTTSKANTQTVADHCSSAISSAQ